MLPHLERKAGRSWRKRIEDSVAEWWKVLESRAMNSADPINPQRVFWELSPRIPDNCILTCDTGSGTNWYARDVKIRRGMMASVSGTLATMGPAVPYAIAAKFAFPNRPVLALVGDGAMQMNGMNELLTIAKYWKRWVNPQLVVLVLSNHDLNQVTWEMRAQTGDPKFEASQEVPPLAFAKYAELLGLKGIYVDKPEQIGRAWEEAFAADRAVVLETVTDPNVPPLPPHITLKNARAFTSTLVSGDPEQRSVIKQTLKELVSDVLGG